MADTSTRAGTGAIAGQGGASAEDRAFEAMLRHHTQLVDGARERDAVLAGAVAAGSPHDAALGELVAYFAGEILPHAKAEEAAIYPVALKRPELTETILSMLDEHRRLELAVDKLAATASAGDAAALARDTVDTFVTHVGKENELVLPALRGGDPPLEQLLENMHSHLTTHTEIGVTGATDRLADVLIEALDELVAQQQADRACRLAAEAWVALRHERPDLGRKLTAVMHRLARSTGAGATAPTAAAGGDAGELPELDVREIPPAQRHQLIFATFHALAPATGFVLVNDHDPKPLRYQFEAEHRGEFDWSYLEAGPRVWKVRIAKSLAAG